MFQGMPKRGDLRRYDAIQEWRYSKDVAESRSTIETRLKAPVSPVVAETPPVAPQRTQSRAERRSAELLVLNGALRRRIKALELEIRGWQQRVDALEEVVAASYHHEPRSVEVLHVRENTQSIEEHSI